MDQTRIQKFSVILEENKKKLTEEISLLEQTGLGDTMSDSLGELSVYDNHPADIGGELFERSKDIALRDNAHLMIEEIENAIKRIKNGSYGTCEACGCEIPEERLEAVPAASLCIQCQQKSEERDDHSRPIEEEVLAPPFHRTFLDNSESDFVGFDGEDALQAVLKYGSSDTPQDIPGTHDYKALFPNSNEHQGIVEASDAIPDEPSAENAE